MLCPYHHKPVRWLDSTHYKCPKCFGAKFVPPNCLVTEYDRCYELERPYRSFEHKSLSSGRILDIIKTISADFKYPIPTLKIENTPDALGSFQGRYGKFSAKRGTIRLRSYAGIVTVIHEFAHYVVFYDGGNAKDELATYHGKDFLEVLPMLLNEIPNLV